MADTSDPSTPPSSTSPTASGAGSSGGPGTPGRDKTTPPDTEAGRRMAAATEPTGDDPGEDVGDEPGEDVGGDEPSTEDDDGDADRTKNTIGNIR